jgi:signal transduction histidine kinase
LKLWQKIFLTTLALVIIVVNVSSIVLLSNNHRLAIEREQQSALSRHSYLVADIKNAIIYTQLIERRVELDDYDVSEIAGEVLGGWRSDTSMAATLFKDGENVYAVNKQPDQAEYEILSEPDYASRIVEVGDKTYLLIVSTAELNGEDYRLVSSFDITMTYELFSADFNQVRAVGIVSALLVAGILLLLVRTLLRPLRNLSGTTRQIASGDLDKRVSITGNDEVSDVARSLNTMADSIEHNVGELEKLAESRKVFIGNLAHEMKTPLTSILGFADILRIKRQITDDERIEYSGVIVGETKRLQGLSSKLMELLSLGNMQLTLENVDIRDLATTIEITLQPVFAHNEIAFVSDVDDVAIRVDNELIKSLFYNLIDNSVKASPQGGTVTFSSDVTPQQVKLSVTDEGSGISEDQIPLLTEPFFMLDKARTRKHGGAGLGLALCAEIARAHGTELIITSSPGAGTCVSVTFAREVENG